MKLWQLRDLNISMAEKLNPRIKETMSELISSYYFEPSHKYASELQDEGYEAVAVENGLLIYMNCDGQKFLPIAFATIKDVMDRRNEKLLEEASMPSVINGYEDFEPTVETANGYAISITEALVQACDPNEGLGWAFMGVRESCGVEDIFSELGSEGVSIGSLFFLTPENHIVHILYVGPGAFNIEVITNKALSIVNERGYRHIPHRAFEG